MRPTDILTNEHKVIKKMLDITSAVCVKLSADEEVKGEHLKEIVSFFKVFADSCHHGKEEKILFKELEQSGFPREGGPIGAMLAEHVMGRKLVAEMAAAADEYDKNKDSAAVRFAQNAGEYINLLRDHIYKEDNILFAMANQKLSKEQHDKLMEKFRNFEHDDMGAGTHEDFLKLVEKLEEEYSAKAV
ncbi:MAG: hemerythrin [candidate division Zixibacteria bacterium]|nr:hemerythrin [candidate division Zixibacteria bacterium]